MESFVDDENCVEDVDRDWEYKVFASHIPEFG